MTKTGRNKMIIMAAALALGLAAMLAASPAEAAFPGKNGKIIFWSDRSAGPGLYTIIPGGTATKIPGTSGGDNDAVWSPEGGRIAFISGNTTTNSSNEVFMMNADGSGRRQITNTSSVAEQEPAWSPDGTKLIYTANSFDVDGQTDPEIWTINADGTGRRQLTNNTFPDTQPAWSPDGTKIAFVSARTGDTNRNVYVMNADGSGQTSITPNSPTGCTQNCYQGHDDGPAWSPDGQKIAYVHGYGPPTNPFAGGGLPNIWTMDPTGANKTNVSNNPDVSDTQPAWSPDGNRIVYARSGDIYVMDTNGGNTTPVDTTLRKDEKPDWQQDSIPPQTTITSGPQGLTASTTASFGFVSSETFSSFECSLDGTVFASCASPKSYAVGNGTHTLQVKATDVAGNVDATPAVRTWTVDATKPAISGMSPRHKSVISDTTPKIKATIRDNNVLREANIKLYVAGKRISAAKFSYAASTGSLVYNSPKLTKGKKTVKLVATDSAGNVGVKSWYFTIR